jgi:phosphoenolpyruvate synthase/pyruvate phosphate dikinase
MTSSSPHVRWFESVRLEDVALVGSKNASPGEMYRSLGFAGVRGLGKNVIQGTVDPDEFFVYKLTFMLSHHVVLRRTPGQRVPETMARHGLEHGRNRLEVFVMCEIPNTVIKVDAFIASRRSRCEQRRGTADYLLSHCIVMVVRLGRWHCTTGW